MSDHQEHVDVSPQVDQLARFKAWSVWCSHYAVTEAIARFQVLEENNPAAIDQMVEKIDA